MIWILLLYVLPLAISIVGAYWITKIEGGTVQDFLEPLPYLFIPLFNIVVIVIFIGDFLQEDESWQNFKNKKL
jgi:hypothetical protein